MNSIAIAFISMLGLVSILIFAFFRYIDHFKKLNLLYKIDESKKVVVQKNLEYKKSGDQSLFMDVYTPDRVAQHGKFPAIIFLHGEGIERMLRDIKDWNLYTSYGKLAASKGYAGITFHRSRTNMSFNQSEVAQDILDAVAFVRENADRWSIDKDRICIWGFSLGGLYLSLFFKNAPQYVRCLISYYGLLDVKFKIKNLNKAHLNYQPENYLPENSDSFPPFLLVKAGKDSIKGVITSQDHFMQIARERNLPFEYILHSTGRHSFDAIDNSEETGKVMVQTWDFIQRNL